MAFGAVEDAVLSDVKIGSEVKIELMFPADEASAARLRAAFSTGDAGAGARYDMPEPKNMIRP
ncbi:MAG: hypothetical protein AAFW46_07440 [Pseudomonadota bacterium]